MGKIVAAQSPQNVWNRWEPRIMQARERLAAMSWDDTQTQLAIGSIVMDDLNIILKPGNDVQNPYPATARALQMEIKDASGNVAAIFPILKIKETP